MPRDIADISMECVYVPVVSGGLKNAFFTSYDSTGILFP
jgi:hypothetical protein